MSDSFVVRACGPLHGTVRVSGATKNAGTKQMAAALLAPGVTTLRNVDPVADLDVMIDVLRAIGAQVEWTGPTELQIDAVAPLHAEAPYELVTRMRASINVLGPLLARCGEARVAMPGGDNIGSRKLDMHFRGLEAMGVELDVVHGFIEARTNRLSGARVMLEFPSVGATENLLTAAVLAKGETVIENAAREPEVGDVALCLTKMGAKVEGIGTSTLRVQGRDRLEGAVHTVLPDRIETGTFAIAVAATGGDVTLEGGRVADLKTALEALAKTGTAVQETKTGIRVARNGADLEPVSVETQPFPGFPTDLQAQLMALLTRADGTSVIRETIFENRFMHVQELARLGADIQLQGDTATIRGVKALKGAPVMATDLRASVSLVIAGLAGEGETMINRVYHLDRGFEQLEQKLSRCGADIERLAG
jgi:UDP-N-acetylglucosamine 1-carboxyvinyltransferase